MSAADAFWVGVLAGYIISGVWFVASAVRHKAWPGIVVALFVGFLWPIFLDYLLAHAAKVAQSSR